MSDRTYELKFYADSKLKVELVECLRLRGWTDLVDCFDDLDIDEQASSQLIDEIINTQSLSFSIYSLQDHELSLLHDDSRTCFQN